jgi:hypothetical protein
VQTLVYGESRTIHFEIIQWHDESADAGGRSIGTYNWDSVVEIEYPAAFQEALLKVLDVNKTFTYVYLGGAFTEEDQEKTLWFYSKGRRVRVHPVLAHPLTYNRTFYSPCVDMLMKE